MAIVGPAVRCFANENRVVAILGNDDREERDPAWRAPCRRPIASSNRFLSRIDTNGSKYAWPRRMPSTSTESPLRPSWRGCDSNRRLRFAATPATQTFSSIGCGCVERRCSVPFRQRRAVRRRRTSGSPRCRSWCEAAPCARRGGSRSRRRS